LQTCTQPSQPSQVSQLARLRAGELAGAQSLTLSENLSEFPLEILSLADSLEVLDLSNNQLSSLPETFCQLHKLNIVFLSNNQFDTLPEVLGQCPNLEMIGCKSNGMTQVPAHSLPAKLRWLILSDNRLTTLPDSLGERPRLQKLALAGNRLTALPQTLANAGNLELLRISANQLGGFPAQLLELPKLAWLSFSGNPFAQTDIDSQNIPEVPSSSFTLQQQIGQGASGVISTATWNTPQHALPDAIAVKVFKGDVTSDGYPKDELHACLIAGKHPNLVQPLAQVNEPGYLALVMKLIAPHYRNLGLPPSLTSCTRDTFTEGFSLSINHIDKIVQQMQQVFEHLHNHHICHGDLYTHNTLFDDEANIIFGDFGAASLYHMLNPSQQQKIKRIEQRALDYFIEDLLTVCAESDKKTERYIRLKRQTQEALR